MIRPDDPAVTAYVLGELSAAERAEVDLAAASDPAVRAALDDASAAAGVLTTALKQELSSDAGPVLDSSQRAAILERAASGAPILTFTSRLRRWGLFAATAAAVMVGAFVWMNQPADHEDATGPRSMWAFRDGDWFLSPTDWSVTVPSELPEGQGRISIGDRDGIISGWKGTGVVPALRAGALDTVNQKGIADVVTGATSNQTVTQNVLPVRTPESGSGGGSGGVSTWLAPGFGGSGKPVRVALAPGANRPNVEVFFGTPANPRGVPFGVHPEQQTAGTSKDSGVSFVPPKLDFVPSDAVNDESNPLFGGESERAESYRAYVENAFLIPKGDVALSTFSIDVDTASYANVRRMLTEGHLPSPDAVRVEELVNYFPYAYAPPTGDDPFAVHLEVAGCPWNTKHRLVRVGIKGKEIARKERPASNLVFLLDVSGSMDAPNKLPLVKASLRMLLDELNERDRVSIVVYAGSSGMALPPTSCEKKNTILEAIDKLVPSGSTNGAAGIQLAYDTATSSFIPGGVNRVVLCTDGDFNVGATSHAELLKLIEEKAKSKVFLTALGYGMGNYKDDTLELLADKGNGNYGYIDSTREAHKVLVEQSSGTLVTIAKDVKLQVEFNPATVAAYRLVGYDNRLLAAKDFNDDTKDAGEIGAGHTVTAFYEIVPVGVELPVAAADKPVSVDPLKYQQPVPPLNVSGFPPTPRVIVFPNPLPVPVLVPMTPAAPVIFSPTYVPTATSTDLLTVKLRWKAPEGDVSTKKEFALADGGATYDKASADFQFASAVTAFALLLKQSPHRGTANVDAVLEIAGSSLGNDPGAWRAEFVDLVKKAKSLSPTK